MKRKRAEEVVELRRSTRQRNTFVDYNEENLSNEDNETSVDFTVSSDEEKGSSSTDFVDLTVYPAKVMPSVYVISSNDDSTAEDSPSILRCLQSDVQSKPRFRKDKAPKFESWDDEEYCPGSSVIPNTHGSFWKKSSDESIVPLVSHGEEKHSGGMIDIPLHKTIDNLRRESICSSISLIGRHLSEYEKQRLENIKKNEEMLMALNFKQVKDALKTLKYPNRRMSEHLGFVSKRTLKPKVELPRRMSLRIRGQIPKPPTDYFYDPVIRKPEPERKPSGPLDMDPTNNIENEESQRFLKKLVKESDQEIKVVEEQSVKSYKESISKLHVLPHHVAKMVPQRIISMAFHPSITNSIICAGDKGGNIGFWDVDSKKSPNNGIFIYEPHSSSVSALGFHPNENNNLYSCSYDGTVRCADFNTCVFDEVCCSDDARLHGLTFLSSCLQTIMLARSDGKVARVDTREKKSSSTLHKCHLKSIKCIHCHPNNSNLICTSSADATVALWDMRKMKNATSKLDSVHLGRSVTSAYFSPISGKHILATSLDDSVGVFEVTSSSTLEAKRTIKHFNQTGRFLTPFKAAWDEKNDSGIVIGSMLSRRRVQVYHSEQSARSPFVELFDEKYDTITSINVFHNARNILASGNSSGKVYIWTEKI